MNRRRPLLLLVAFALVAWLLAGPTPAEGQNGCSGLDRNGAECVVVVGGGSTPSAGGHTVASSSPPGPTFVWINTGIPCESAGGGGWSPVTGLGAAIGEISTLAGLITPTEPGLFWIGELVDPAAGPTDSGFVSCVGDGDAVPALPPPLPTAGEIWGEVLTYEPAVNLDPFVRGLTGLETYMWYEGPTGDTVTITLNGYTVTATIAAVEFRWDMGAPDRTGVTAHVSTAPGSATAPAALHIYAEPAETLIVHEILWTGSSVITGAGVPGGGITIDLGEATLATARDYDVIEVRTPLTGG